MTHFHLYYYDGNGEAATAGRYDDLETAQRKAAEERVYEREQAEVESRQPMRVLPKRCVDVACGIGA